MTINRALELANGVWSILGLILLFSILQYLIIESRTRGLTWQRWIFGLPVSMQLGVGIAVLTLGIEIRSVSVWIWRAFYETQRLDQISLAIGAVIAAAGMLCLIRIVSRPRYGHRLWTFGLVVTVAFVIVTLLAKDDL